MRSGRARIKILINQTAYFIHPQPHYTPNKVKNKANKKTRNAVNPVLHRKGTFLLNERKKVSSNIKKN